MLLGPCGDDLIHRLVVGHPVLDLQESGVLLQLRTAHDVAQNAVELVVAGGNDHVAVLGREGVIGIGGLIAVADPLGNPAGGLIDHGDILHGGGHGIHQSNVNLLPQTGFLAVHQSGQYADGQVQAAQHVAHRRADTGGLSAGPAGGAHQAAHGLPHDVIACTLAQGAGVAKAGDGAVDDRRIDLLEHIVAQAQLFHGAGAVVLNDNVRLFHHFLENLFCLRVFQIQRAAHLAAVEVGEIHAVVVDEGAHAAAVIAALGIFNLDDRCTHVGQDGAAVRSCQHPRQIQNDHAVQKPFIFTHLKHLVISSIFI